MKKISFWLASFLVVIIIFHICYGLRILIPINVSWLMTIRHDWGQHYLGWLFYRNEPWQFPIGAVDHLFYPVGTNVGFTDSIPLLAIFFKLFASILPQDFQYFGLWLFACHLLAAYYTIRLFRLFKINDLYTFFAVIFIAANPVLVYRGLHPALCGHWLLIASIYVYFLDPSKIRPAKILLKQFILLIVAGLVNPYLCFMVLGFTAVTAIKLCFAQKAISKKYFFSYLGGSLFVLFFCWYIVGMVSFGHKEDIAVASGYGLYGLNLNSLYNPRGFSTFLPSLDIVSPHQYEGFMYLGLGMFLILLILFVYAVVSFIQKRMKKNYFKPPYTFANTPLVPLFILILLFTLFSISHVVSINDKVLFKVPLPKIIIELGDVFRASARFFWMVYYLIFFFAIVAIAKSRFSNTLKLGILSAAIILQLYDTKLLLSFRNPTYGSYEPPIDSKNWNALFNHFDEIIFYPPFETTNLTHMDYQDFCYLAAKAKKPITTGYVARVNSSATKLYNDSLTNDIEEGRLSRHALYITTAANLHYFSYVLQTDSCRLNYLDGYYYIFSSSKDDSDLRLLSDRINNRNKQKIDSAVALVGKKAEFVKVSDTSLVKPGNVHFFIERFTEKGGYVSLSGWAFRENAENNKNDSVFVALKSGKGFYLARTILQSRPDVTSHFHKEYLDNAGFNAQVFNTDVEKGIYNLCIAVKDVNGNMTYSLSDKVIKVKISEYAAIEKIDTIAAEDKIVFNAETVQQNDTAIYLSGWAYLKDQDALNSTIAIVLKNNNDFYLSLAEPMRRPDVTSYFKSKYNLDNSGFTIKLSKASLPKGKYQIGILIRDDKRKKESMIFTGRAIDI